MSGRAAISELELHGFLDGELPASRMAEIDAALAADPALAARVAAFRADQARLRAAFAPVAWRPVPANWIARIEAAPAPSPRRTRLIATIAAAVVLVVGTGLWNLSRREEPILEQAARARAGLVIPVQEFAGTGLPAPPERDRRLDAALGMRLKVPDLGRYGYALASIELYRDRQGRPAAGLLYRNAAARELSIYVRPSDGRVRFDLLRQGNLRICLWQDDVIGAVLTGEMSAGEMMRIASRAYADLNL